MLSTKVNPPGIPGRCGDIKKAIVPMMRAIMRVAPKAKVTMVPRFDMKFLCFIVKPALKMTGGSNNW